MCIEVQCKNGEMIGYKGFELNEKLKPLISFTGGVPRLGRWIKSNDGRMGMSHTGKYEKGFHILLTLEDAIRYWENHFDTKYLDIGLMQVTGTDFMEYVYDDDAEDEIERQTFAIYKVKYKNVVAFGTQEGAKVVVAKNMMILEQVSENKLVDMIY